MAATVGCFEWGSSSVLASFLYRYREYLVLNQRILELGAGQCDATLALTDGPQSLSDCMLTGSAADALQAACKC